VHTAVEVQLTLESEIPWVDKVVAQARSAQLDPATVDACAAVPPLTADKQATSIAATIAPTHRRGTDLKVVRST
jgi:hypothetical protein